MITDEAIHVTGEWLFYLDGQLVKKNQYTTYKFYPRTARALLV